MCWQQLLQLTSADFDSLLYLSFEVTLHNLDNDRVFFFLFLSIFGVVGAASDSGSVTGSIVAYDPFSCEFPHESPVIVESPDCPDSMLPLDTLTPSRLSDASLRACLRLDCESSATMATSFSRIGRVPCRVPQREGGCERFTINALNKWSKHLNNFGSVR